MPTFTVAPPLSLYIHLPWCVRKCPYCDFNSHEMKDALPEALYVSTLLQELDAYLPLIGNRPIISIFFGGGTPSLFSASMIEKIIAGVEKRTSVNSNAEVTMEANPGTIDQMRFKDFRLAGINRLSLGIQSLQDAKLKTLGRIHDRDHAMRAITIAKEAGFTNFNLDLMYGLPNQTIEESIDDLEMALTFQPSHLSWYQLTIEPNTVFYKQTPVLPHEDTIWEMQLAGQAVLHRHGLIQYEVSAYSLPNQQCVHNLNYWKFGDYLGIGAGAHSKITDLGKETVMRFSQVKQPRDYLDKNKRRIFTLPTASWIQHLSQPALIFEFMLNALRLTDGTPAELFTLRTGLPLTDITSLLMTAKQRGLLLDDGKRLCASALGSRYLNDLVTLFLE